MSNGSFQIFAALQVAVVAIVLWIMFFRTGPWNIERIAGTVLFIVGTAGIATARYHLGRSFSVTAQARYLVTTGIYSKIRNPIYVFGTVALVGFALVWNHPESWIFVAAITVIQMVRAHSEAKVLEDAFGDAYREYRRQTWF
ncbi:MAG TPA: isoprenylcysteine carboxylmethyltransferase family protein [Candidatus Binatia bacterium]|nr:isoprenylcysteine carboxylmethyltransferase family protein [Candidatus Binatia bacterium]